MANCDVCGKPIEQERRAMIEGSEFTVCEDCIRLGKEVHMHGKNVEKEEILGIEEQALSDEWPQKIREKRELLTLTQDELGKKLGEHASVVRRLEEGRLVPDDLLAEKIEGLLKIELHVQTRKRGKKK